MLLKHHADVSICNEVQLKLFFVSAAFIHHAVHYTGTHDVLKLIHM